MTDNSHIPVDVTQLFPVLDKELLSLLKSLSPEEWQAPTIAKLWKVKDVAAHLLDGNIRVLSLLRDNHWGEQPDIQTPQDLLDFLNRLNADWVTAMKRVSPGMLVFLLELTGKPFCEYMASLPPFEKSILTVDWAGETESRNWMEVAREYTEKWLHQQQIRDTVKKPGLMTSALFYPFIDIFMMALPHTYRHMDAPEGSTVKVTVSTDIGGSWWLTKSNNRWLLSKNGPAATTAALTIDPDTAWKLFSKSLRPEQVSGFVQLQGDRQLAAKALSMVAVMA
ncbi:MAG: maleylpyruvate isomerase N-terminal domain-containing protein [Ferruginibacter sp.]